MREYSGLSLILSHCNIDDMNPCKCVRNDIDIREQSLFAIRNLTENNALNQDYFASLEANRTAPHPVLKQLGLQTEMDEFGKVRFVV